MLELLQRITAINSYAKDCHYNFQTYGQHQLADVNQENLLEYKDLINEVCYLGLGMDAPESDEVLSGALNFIPEVSEDDQANLARLKLLVKMTLIHIEDMKLETRGIENLVGAIAQDLQQLHGLLYKVVDDEEDIKYLEKIQNAEKDDELEWITVKGNHIPVKEGQTKEEAVKEFLYKKEKDGGVGSPKKADIKTKEFKSWFGKSKAVDKNGEPLILYHGTDAENIDVFDKSKGFSASDAIGSWFGENKKISDQRIKDRGGKGKVYEVYLNIEKPLEVKSRKELNMRLAENMENISNEEEIMETLEEDLKSYPKDYKISLEDLKQYKDNKESKEIRDKVNLAILNNFEVAFRDELIPYLDKAVEKYDGVIIEDDMGYGRSFVAFKPNQIKSIYNKGTFSKEDNNVNNQSESEDYKYLVPEGM